MNKTAALESEAASGGSHVSYDTLGLSEAEAEARRIRGLGATAPLATGRTYRQIISENLFTFMNMTLFGLGVALVLLGRPTDGVLSTGVIALNTLVSVAQEIRAKRKLDQVALLTRPVAVVIRDGHKRQVRPEELVVGDVLVATAGDQIVADGRVLGESRMEVDESLLSGESELVHKQAGDLVYSGSFCTSGRANYLAERVGAESLASNITSGARAFRRVVTPLQRGIDLVIRIVLVIVGYVQFLLVLRAIMSSADLTGSVQNATVVAGLVPNGLFLSISVAYALGAVRILGQGVLVQQSNAIDSLSNVDTMCLDKTGTLTANRLQVEDVYPLSPEVPQLELTRVLGAVVASATSQNKTTQAIAAAFPAEPHRLVAEVPFSSERKWSAVMLDDSTERNETLPLKGVYVLGAPDVLRPRLRSDAVWPEIEMRVRTFTQRGERVLLITCVPDGMLEPAADPPIPPANAMALGLVSLADELRPEAAATLAALQRAGVRPKMISGDDPDTVASLARQAGLDPGQSVVAGPDLERMDDAAVAAVAGANVVFGRTTPQQKERLVKALRAQGAFVGMIGDGVNDVLSLKAADLGIAMQTGSQAARAVADIVLLDDSFASLVPSIAEGQRIVNGMVPILQLYLTRVATMGLVIVSAVLVGQFPLGLRNASLITLLTVGVPSLFLALWAQPGAVARSSVPLRVARFVASPTLLASGISLLLFYGLLLAGPLAARGLQHSFTQAELEELFAARVPAAQTGLTTFLVCCGLLLVVFAVPPRTWWAAVEPVSGDWRPTLLASSLAALFVGIVVWPPGASLFSLAVLHPADVCLVALAVLAWLLAVRFAWHKRWIERFLGIPDGASEPRPPHRL